MRTIAAVVLMLVPITGLALADPTPPSAISKAVDAFYLEVARTCVGEDYSRCAPAQDLGDGMVCAPAPRRSGDGAFPASANVVTDSKDCPNELTGEAYGDLVSAYHLQGSVKITVKVDGKTESVKHKHVLNETSKESCSDQVTVSVATLTLDVSMTAAGGGSVGTAGVGAGAGGGGTIKIKRTNDHYCFQIAHSATEGHPTTTKCNGQASQ